MKNMTTNGKLLAQDDIDTLLGEAGVEGNYDSEALKAKPARSSAKKSKVRFTKRTKQDITDILGILHDMAFLEREEDVHIIWNAAGKIPLTTGLDMKIQGIEYVSLGVLRENHLVVKYKE